MEITTFINVNFYCVSIFQNKDSTENFYLSTTLRFPTFELLESILNINESRHQMLKKFNKKIR